MRPNLRRGEVRMVRRLGHTRLAGLFLAGLVLSNVMVSAGPASADHDLATTTRIGSGFSPSISFDGTKIAYASSASDLVTGDTNGFTDIFLYDTIAGTTTLVSRDTHGGPADGQSLSPSISADGTAIVYLSEASDLVAGDTNGHADVFLYDTTTGATTSVSGGVSWEPYELYYSFHRFSLGRRSINADGTKIAFVLQAEGAGDCETLDQGFLYDTATGSAVEAWKGVNPSISGDGTRIAYREGCDAMFVGYHPGQVYLRNLVDGTTTLISKEPDGSPSSKGGFTPSLSFDGTKVAYTSVADDPYTEESSADRNVLLYDTLTDTTTLVNKDVDSGSATGGSFLPSINADGTAISYQSSASTLVEGDTNESVDVFRFETLSVRTTMISTDPVGGPAIGDSLAPSISGDGTKTVYSSDASNLVGGVVNDAQGLYLAFRPFGVVVYPDVDSFEDDDGSIFEPDIEWLAAAGITGGCSADGSRFCPDEFVTRGQVAAFLVRALGYVDDGGGDVFVDDDDSIFEGDIDRLATAGVTRGCSADGSRFCPDEFVTRGQVAAFLHRALG